jgi:hypothetical protein
LAAQKTHLRQENARPLGRTLQDVRKLLIGARKVSESKRPPRLAASFSFGDGSLATADPCETRNNLRRHPEEPRSCAASRRTATGTRGYPSRLAAMRRAPQDDGGVFGCGRRVLRRRLAGLVEPARQLTA